MGEKWKPSDSSSHGGCSDSFFSSSNQTSNSPLLRSSSCRTPSSSSNCDLPRSYSQKNPSICRKCSNLAKEHRARFYIIRRCVAMLVCWHKHRDS